MIKYIYHLISNKKYRTWSVCGVIFLFQLFPLQDIGNKLINIQHQIFIDLIYFKKLITLIKLNVASLNVN